MALTPRDVTDTELAILQILWDRGGATRPQVTESLYPGGGAAQYATVQKLLERLEAKGFVARRRGDGPLTFRATLRREDLLGRRLQDLADQLCGGSVTPLILNLVQSESLTPAELDELRALIEERRRRPRPKGKSR
jgi:predicted transcriptional regulator